jgi:AcrR family transcriptional regulator
MPKDKTASHVRVIAAAREEFLEYGFEKASMRRVGERCGLTAAGLYRHCRDKEDLFDQLAAPALERLNVWMDTHLAKYLNAVREQESLQWQDSWIDMMRDLVYPSMEDYHLLLTCSQGTKYEHFLHDLTENAQKEMLDYLPVLQLSGLEIQPLGKKEMHLVMSAYVTALFEPVIHQYSQDEALRCLKAVESFFLPGWKTLFGFAYSTCRTGK